MKKQTKKPTDAEFIRRKAEALLKEKQSDKSVSLTEIETIKLLYELEVHQIELEMQKEELQLAKEKAETNAEKYTNLYDYSPAGYFTINGDGEICELNFNAAKMLNKERSKLINRNFKFFITSETRSLFIDFLNRVSATKTNQNCEVRLTINEKPSNFVHIEGILLENEKKYLLTVIDISKRKQAERELKDSMDDLERIFNLSAYMVCISTPDGIFQKVSPAFTETLGFSEKEFLSQPFINFVHPDDKKATLDNMEPLARGIPTIRFANRYKCKDGSYKWLEWTGRSFVTGGAIYAIAYDITNRKKGEEELKESEVRIRLFTQNVPDFLLLIDSTGKINYINKTLEGLTQKDVIGSSVYSWIPEEFLEKFKAKVEKVFRSGASEIIEYPGNGLKGEPIWFESKIGPFEKSGIITQVIIVSRDITERKSTEIDLKTALNEIIELKQKIEAENIYLKEELKLEGSFNEIIGSNKSLVKVLKQVEQVAKTDTTVFILGETGTGKELIAKAIHNASDRKNKPLIKVNCSALPAELIESELFGHEKGAFTGAINRKIGRFELANGGTLFLDEIGDLPIGLQSRLLRVLQESEFERVGGEKTIKVDVRVITATNRNLAKQVLENKFRQDLYYRLNVFPITCPPLRDRIDDIQSLVHHFVNKYNPKVNNKIKTVHQKTIERLMHYNWPGNIRELEHVIERAIILNQGGQLRLGKWFMDSNLDTIVSDDLTTLEIVERDYIIKVLEKTNWKIRGKNGAAEILGMQPTTLESRMKKRDIRR